MSSSIFGKTIPRIFKQTLLKKEKKGLCGQIESWSTAGFPLTMGIFRYSNLLMCLLSPHGAEHRSSQTPLPTETFLCIISGDQSRLGHTLENSPQLLLLLKYFQVAFNILGGPHLSCIQEVDQHGLRVNFQLQKRQVPLRSAISWGSALPAWNVLSTQPSSQLHFIVVIKPSASKSLLSVQLTASTFGYTLNNL